MELRYSRENPSKRYTELVGLYRQMHQEGIPDRGVDASKVYAGSATLKRLAEIKAMVDRTGAKTLLEYGSGKGTIYSMRGVALPSGDVVDSVAGYLGVEGIECYDPGVPENATLPAGTFDGVFTVEVLEHCPESDLPWILEEIFSKARLFVFATVGSYPARKTLPNGENAHCTQRGSAWWRAQLAEIGCRYPDVLFDFHVKEQRQIARLLHPIVRSWHRKVRISNVA